MNEHLNSVTRGLLAEAAIEVDLALESMGFSPSGILPSFQFAHSKVNLAKAALAEIASQPDHWTSAERWHAVDAIVGWLRQAHEQLPSWPTDLKKVHGTRHEAIGRLPITDLSKCIEKLELVRDHLNETGAEAETSTPV